jgi:hypothetical protein
MTVVDRNIIKGLRDIRERIDLDPVPTVPPRKIGDSHEIPRSFNRLEKLEQRFFRRVPPHDIVNKGILAEDLLMKIGGRKAAQNNGGPWVMAFDDFSESQGTLNMGHPMEIEAEGSGFLLQEKALDIEPFIFKHFKPEINNPDPKAMPLQIL